MKGAFGRTDKATSNGIRHDAAEGRPSGFSNTNSLELHVRTGRGSKPPREGAQPSSQRKELFADEAFSHVLTNEP